jgi:hypothetical protein
VYPSTIQYGQSATISWGSQYANSGWINNNVGSVNTSGSRTVYPTYTTTYTGTFYGQNGQHVTCSATVSVYNYNYVPPVPNIPYITLSAVPYTGLELGPVGTAIYWSFLILWCLVAAYLIAVKKVHYAIARRLKSFLFGTSENFVRQISPSSLDIDTLATMVRTIIEGPAMPKVSYSGARAGGAVDATDSFILSQINRQK